ncbi:inner membrane protein YhjD [Actinophytocola xinjiangensis]|uniref:Inner membrane protein YhjD n=1 Tax=Actinophytocola xinjiangensis TaxID=485602 RepID=A0A7Z0WEY0_9PSEU|nr:inner membrane protein YhjD [Actinophytocola xinjiangensis]OLF05053.1 inner membrane protein YhjD [Actinophytocola xinjiangensis]
MGDPEADNDSFLTRQRARRSWLDHLVRAGGAYGERNGNHYAAAITYFSVLSIFPLLMIAFAVAGFVLAGNAQQLTELKESITEAVPSGLSPTINEVIDASIKQRNTVGIIGLLAAVYSGLGWMSNLRDALTAQWGQEHRQRPFLRTAASDLLSLLGLGLALVVSFGLTAAGGGLGSWLLGLVGLDEDPWASFLLAVGSVVLGLFANWVVFLWVLSRLPREKVGVRSAVKGAVAAAVGFEVLKQVFTVYLGIVLETPAGSVFGPIIGLLLFANLVSRFLLFITAWTATARENARVEVPQPPPPAVIRPSVRVRRLPGLRDALPLVGAGALLGYLWRRGNARS